MKNNNLIPAPVLSEKSLSSWTEKDFISAIKKFRQNAQSAPIPRLYEAYRWFKEKVDKDDQSSDQHFSRFTELFLRILEERGAVKSEIYSEVLRDSAEYKYLKKLFHNDEPEGEIELTDSEEKQPVSITVIKKIAIEDILHKKNISLVDIDISSWNKMVNEYFKDFKTAESFEKNCTGLLKNVIKRKEKEPYHIEVIVACAFDRLLKYKKLSLKTKDFAMQLLNLTIDQGDLWRRLHSGYMEIIRR